VDSAPVAQYREWPFQGFLKSIKIGNETTYNLEFQLLHIPEHLHLHLPILSEALGMRSDKKTSAEAATPHDAGGHSKMHSAAVRPQIKRVRWAPEEDATILKMREEDGCSWEDIHAALPHRTKDAIQVRYSTKLKK
jgi:Myb-like DNA-binding domain